MPEINGIGLESVLAWLQNAAMSVVGKLVFALIIYIVGRWVISFIKRAFSKWNVKKNISESALGFMSSCISVVLNLILILTIASILGVPMTSIIALVGSAGLAVGLALQGGLSNFAGGVIILIFKPFEVGDYIVCGGDEGTVSKISVFYTTLVTVDNRHIVIPNSTVSGSVVTNVTVEPERRVDINISVPAGTDVDAVKAALTSAADGDERVSQREKPVAHIIGFGAGCYNLELRVWCKTEDYWDMRFDLTRTIPEKLANAGIVIAKNAVVVSVDK